MALARDDNKLNADEITVFQTRGLYFLIKSTHRQIYKRLPFQKCDAIKQLRDTSTWLDSKSVH